MRRRISSVDRVDASADAVSPGTDAEPTDSGIVTPVDSAIPDDGGCTSAMEFVRFASFGTEVNTNYNEVTPRLSANELVMYFARFDGVSKFSSLRVNDIYVAARR